MHKLGVNIDHIATLRQARGVNYPEPLFAALIAESAGASNITIHIREDRRHAQERDLELITKSVSIKVNLEMAATEDLKRIALQYKPESITLVPEKRAELTTEGGLDLISADFNYLKDYIAEIKKNGIEVSLFIDTDSSQINKAIELGANAVEFNTGRYSESKSEEEENLNLERIRIAVDYARTKNLKTHVGHGIHYHNIQKLAALRTIEEFNIGHSIVARAVFTGFEKAVKDMLHLLGL